MRGCRLAVSLLTHLLVDCTVCCSLRYVSIAAQFDRGFCGVVTDTGVLACYNVYNAPAPESIVLPAPSSASVKFAYPLWLCIDENSPLFAVQACAMRSDGFTECAFSLPEGARSMSQATSINSVVMGATSEDGWLQQTDPAHGWIVIPAITLFEVLCFIGVDPAQGNDALCAPFSLPDAVGMKSFVPCASLARALMLIAHSNTWIQLLPGMYSANNLTIDYGATTITSSPPSCLAPTELASLGNGSWVSRMEQTAGQVATIDCTGAANCFSTMLSNVHFINLTFTGSLNHSIWSYSDNSTTGNSRLPPSTLTITNCVFDAIGAVLLKQQGAVTITGCSITNSLQWANTTNGLIELEDASLVMTGTSFSHNHLPIADSFLRSCLRSVSTLPVTMSISDSHWLNNSASSVGASWSIVGVSSSPSLGPGGVALQIQANGPLVLSLVDSTIVQQTVHSLSSIGGQSRTTTVVALCVAPLTPALLLYRDQVL